MTVAINTGKEREVDVLNQEYKVFVSFFVDFEGKINISDHQIKVNLLHIKN